MNEALKEAYLGIDHGHGGPFGAVIVKNGPVLIEVRCACGARSDLGRPTTTPIQNRDALMSFIR